MSRPSAHGHAAAAPCADGAGPEPTWHRMSSDTAGGDDMSASVGVAAAVHEGLAAAERGEAAGVRAAIVIVSREPGAREILHRELSNRYGADYQILACG